MGLENLKVKEEIAKEIYNDWSKKLISNTYNIKQLEIDNETYSESVTNSEEQIVELGKDLSEFEKTLKRLEGERDGALSSRNNDVDRDLINTNPTLLQREINDLIGQRNLAQSNANGVIVTEPSQYYNEDQHKELRGEMANLQGVDIACK
jgi:hypothetical protein